MKTDLELVDDVSGEKLVFAAPPSGVLRGLHEMLTSGGRGLAGFTREIWRRPRSLRGLLGSFGMVLVAAILGALVLLAFFMALVGLALVVVLYAIGIWLVAWLLVPIAARYVLDGGSGRRSRAQLERLSFVRASVGGGQQAQTGHVTWSGEVGGSCSFGALASVRISVRARAGTSCEIALQLSRADGSSTPLLHFSVRRVDRDEEAFDLAMRMARVLGFGAFATTRDRLQGVQIELRPTPPADRQHPFRSYARAPLYHPIPDSAATEIGWDASIEAGFREPTEPLPEVASATLLGAGVLIWKPGSVVELRAGRRAAAKRISWALVVATCVAFALPISVLVMINAVGPLPLTETQLGARLSFAGVMELLTRYSAGAGWVLALVLVARRSGRSVSKLDWSSRTLAIRGDDGSHVAAFTEIVELVLTETADRRYKLSAVLEGRSPQLLLESDADPTAAEAYLSLTVELARALGVAWRSTSDVG